MFRTEGFDTGQYYQTMLTSFLQHHKIFAKYHYFTVVFKSWNIILVSPHIHRTEICRILPSVRRELCNMIEGDRVASRPLCQSHVNVIVIPLINMLKIVNDCSPTSWESIQYPDRHFEYSGWTRKNSSDWVWNSKRWSNVMHSLLDIRKMHWL